MNHILNNNTPTLLQGQEEVSPGISDNSFFIFTNKNCYFHYRQFALQPAILVYESPIQDQTHLIHQNQFGHHLHQMSLSHDTLHHGQKGETM